MGDLYGTWNYSIFDNAWYKSSIGAFNPPTMDRMTGMSYDCSFQGSG